MLILIRNTIYIVPSTPIPPLIAALDHAQGQGGGDQGGAEQQQG